jgi:dihydroorotase
MKTLIKNVKIVNEGKIFEGDILIENDLISKIDSQISEEADQIIDGQENIFYLESLMIRCIFVNRD